MSTKTLLSWFGITLVQGKVVNWSNISSFLFTWSLDGKILAAPLLEELVCIYCTHFGYCYKCWIQLDMFPSLNDKGYYEGQDVYFMKTAQTMIRTLYRCFKVQNPPLPLPFPSRFTYFLPFPGTISREIQLWRHQPIDSVAHQPPNSHFTKCTSLQKKLITSLTGL